MVFLTGEYKCKLDAKSRIVFPAKVKHSLPEGSSCEFIVQKGFEQCLKLYPMSEFDKIRSEIVKLNDFNVNERRLKRQLFRDIVQVDLDCVGRILFPKSVLVHAGVKKEMIIIGMGNHLEIWDPQLFEESRITDLDEYSALAQKHLDRRQE